MQMETLQKDMIAAMKAKDKVRKEAISTLVSAVKKVAIDEGCRDDIKEELVDRVILKEIKTVKEQIDTCPADRTELLASYKRRYAFIEEFAPKLISDENEIKLIIEKLANDNDIELLKANRGKLMKIVASELKGKADMAAVNKIVGMMLK